jgi:hypothetical protein
MTKLDMLQINSIHLNFLSPLNKWKILDLKSLREESEYPSHPRNFEKLISRLEKIKILKSFKDPWSNRKFVYLSHHGLGLVGSDSKDLLTSESASHDAKVTQLVRVLLERECVQSAEIAPVMSQNNQVTRPDAILKAKVNGKNVRIALELELVQKSKVRIKSKINYYLNSDYYDHVIYMFCQKNIYQNYKRYIESEFMNVKNLGKLKLFENPTIFSRQTDLEKSQGTNFKEEISLYDFL